MSFMISGLTFKCLIHFEIFFIWCEKVVQFDSFACSCPVFPPPFTEEALFPIVYSCLLCRRLIDRVSVDSLLGFSVLFQ